jgi:hypothetical protein
VGITTTRHRRKDCTVTDQALISLRASLASASSVSPTHLRALQLLDRNGDWITADCFDPDLLGYCRSVVADWCVDAGV